VWSIRVEGGWVDGMITLTGECERGWCVDKRCDDDLMCMLEECIFYI
jgi:hypothetical protein